LKSLRSIANEDASETESPTPDQDLKIEYYQWRRMVHEMNPIWSQFYKWVSDNNKRVLKFNQRNDSYYDPDAFTAADVGHYETFEYNVNDYVSNDMYNPNESYANVFIVSVIGIALLFY
jgi:hypothetical protein